MENRGRKRAELADQLPADKRACSSTEFRPASSSSSIQTQIGSMNSASEAPECEMETTSSAASVSDRSEGEAEKDSAYGSCDSDGLDDSELRRRIFRDYHHRSSGDQGKIRKILSSLRDDAGPGSHLSALTELCDALSFCTEDSVSNFSLESLSPILVAFAKQENDPDIMLLSIRAITYLCDVLPRSSGFLVRHDVVPALCGRLMAIEYLDVAEQCLQALEKISRDHPLACLQAGAIMAILSYIDFFCTSIQRVALSTVANICKKLPSDCSSPFMDAVPILCTLLQNEDRKLVENVATCLIRIVERVSHSSEMLDELCKHGLIHQASNLIALNSRTTLSQPIYIGLIGLLSRLASGSVAAVRALLELNISSTLRHILSSYDLSRGIPYSIMGDGQCNQVHEVMKLLNELLPSLAGNDKDIPVSSDKEKILMDQPELLQQFGMDILPVLIQVVNSGANLYVSYGCLSVINKLIYFSRSDLLLDMLKNTNISSFLAGIFTRKDHHVLISVLKIAENLLQKLPDLFMSSFIKEGVVYAIDALLMPEKCSQLMFPTSSNIQLSSVSNQKSASKDVLRCLCYAFDIDQSPSPGMKTCKLEKDCVHSLVKHIKATYFATESLTEMGLTEILQKLRNLCVELTDKVLISMNNNDICDQQEENLSHILGQIMAELNGGEYMSTFEFLESGIVKSLVTYLSNGHFVKGMVDHHSPSNYSYVVLKRLEMFARFSLSSTSRNWEDMPLAVLIKKLQSALSSLENFPVILSHVSKPRNAYATIPFGRCISSPCLKVHFVREEGETGLCDYAVDVATVDPFSSLDDVENFLWPKVSTSKAEHHVKVTGQFMGQSKDLPLQGSSDAKSLQGKDQTFMEETKLSGLAEVQEYKARLSPPTPDRAGNVIQAVPGEASIYFRKTRIPAKEDPKILLDVDTSLNARDSDNATTSNVASTSEEYEGVCPTSYSNEVAPPKLIFYLEGKKIDRALTLYQAILQQQVKAEHDIFVGPRFWNEVYKVTYRKATEPKQSKPEECIDGSQVSSAWNYSLKNWQNVPFFSRMLVSELPCGLEKSDPAYEILFLLKISEGLNKFAFHLMSQERKYAFSKGENNDLDDLVVTAPEVPQTEFMNSKLTEKLEQQMRDPLAVSAGSMPLWCNQLIAECPYLFGFEARSKYFRLTAFGSSGGQPRSWPRAVNNSSNVPNDGRSLASGLPREKFLVCRNSILDSAAQMMDRHARHKVILEVEYSEEVGTGLGPTMEFYTLVSHEFQKVGLGMWRGDHSNSTSGENLVVEDLVFLVAPLGLFPRPWSAVSNSLNEIQFSEVIKKFVLLGQVVAKALQDRRVLDLPFSKAFYKLILGQELNIYDIQSFDPELGRVLLEFQALIDRKKLSDSVSSTASMPDTCFRNTRIEDLWLDFTLPGYPDYMLTSGLDHKMVNMSNLEEYVSLIVDATLNGGIFKQVEAFKSGFNQAFPIKGLQIFTEEELEHLLCGEQDTWNSTELLEHIKFDHGYTSSSSPIINLLEIIQEFGCEHRRAFLQFVTGAPRLPPGGLAALNPKLTIVRKHCSELVDGDLPSVMTCANYLKLPPYSSKERMRERLLYAITEGQGSFHLS